MKFAHHNDLTLSYKVYGNGQESLLCFHGHGKDATDYAFLEKPNRKIISINLFFHSESEVGIDRIEKNPITIKELNFIINAILDLEEVTNFHLIAYSQGGRFALCILPYFATRLKSVHLLTIDGMDNNNFYSWTQRKWLTRKLFKRWTRKRQELNSLAAFLAKTKVIDKKLYDFLLYYTDEKERITLGYQAWAGFRKLQPNHKKIQHALKKHNILFSYLIGKKDKIITLKTARKFLKNIDQEDNLTVLPFGHDLFKPEAQEVLLKTIQIEKK